jgi:hypothetical protein
VGKAEGEAADCIAGSARIAAPERSFAMGLRRFRRKYRGNPPGDSAEKPSSSERAIRDETSGHCERVVLGAFQRDLLGQHDVADRQLAHRQKTQPERRTAALIELADIRRGACMDPVPLAGVAADDLETALFGELRPLDRRQPLPQQPQGSALRSSLHAVPDEEGPCSPPARALTRARRPKAQHDQPPTSLGKNTVSSALGSNDRTCET